MNSKFLPYQVAVAVSQPVNTDGIFVVVAHATLLWGFGKKRGHILEYVDNLIRIIKLDSTYDLNFRRLQTCINGIWSSLSLPIRGDNVRTSN